MPALFAAGKSTSRSGSLPFRLPALSPRKRSALIRVLIADDHDAIRRGVRSVLLTNVEIDVCAEAANGKEAIAKALECQPDIIILDLTMPVMGGFAAAIELRRILPDVPILFYSMHQGEHLIREAKRIGVQGFVSKGSSSETLLGAVDALVVRKGTFFPPAR
jgi:DNA-binding NarL/FixJ family response regulator